MKNLFEIEPNDIRTRIDKFFEEKKQGTNMQLALRDRELSLKILGYLHKYKDLVQDYKVNDIFFNDYSDTFIVISIDCLAVSDFRINLSYISIEELVILDDDYDFILLESKNNRLFK